MIVALKTKRCQCDGGGGDDDEDDHSHVQKYKPLNYLSVRLTCIFRTSIIMVTAIRGTGDSQAWWLVRNLSVSMTD